MEIAATRPLQASKATTVPLGGRKRNVRSWRLSDLTQAAFERYDANAARAWCVDATVVSLRRRIEHRGGGVIFAGERRNGPRLFGSLGTQRLQF